MREEICLIGSSVFLSLFLYELPLLLHHRGMVGKIMKKGYLVKELVVFILWKS
jgi:hypothetical protein